MFKNFVLITLITLGLMACSSLDSKYNKLDTKEVVIQKITIQEELLVPCVAAIPMGRDEYLKLMPFNKEVYLTNYAIGLLGTIKDCNIKLKKIKELSDSQ